MLTVQKTAYNFVARLRKAVDIVNTRRVESVLKDAPPLLVSTATNWRLPPRDPSENK